jgi:hypothetical protein
MSNALHSRSSEDRPYELDFAPSAAATTMDPSVMAASAWTSASSRFLIVSLERLTDLPRHVLPVVLGEYLGPNARSTRASVPSRSPSSHCRGGYWNDLDFPRREKSTDTIYNVVDHESNPSHYQLSADFIVIHHRITSYKALQHWLTHLLHRLI